MDQVARAIQRLVEIGLGIDPVEMAIQITATLLLILVVKFFFWEKVTAFIEARQALMDQELTDATQKRTEAETLKQEAEDMFESVRREARELLEEAKTRGEDTRRDLLAKAKSEAAEIKKSAQKDMAQEFEVARSQLRHEIITVAAALTEKVIARDIDEATYETLIDEAIEAVRKS
ncbi:MAG: ATP synthase F0 subunit B [Acholeplasmatales bacterium]|nr:MAG: ATP synthase F0 subunit B [Acholeplasmatales bacterium]